MPKTKKFIGDIAKDLRQLKGLTLARAAMEIGVSLNNYRLMEQGYVAQTKHGNATFVPRVEKWIKANRHLLKPSLVTNEEK
jgi:transcriptional regulator with XRE-family HTH domain